MAGDQTFPTIIEKPGSIAGLDATLQWLKSHTNKLKQGLDSSGAILFRGFPITTAEDFDRFSAAFDYLDFTYSESLSNAVRINFTPRVFTANEAPPSVEIQLHHEMAQTPLFPEKIFFCCLQSAQFGGATPICRSDWLYADFKSAHPVWAEQFERLGLKYSTRMPASDDASSGQGRSWRSTLSVETVQAAESKLAELGYQWQWQPDDSLIATTPALPAVRHLADGSQSFFNQVIAAYLGWQRTSEGLEGLLTFGNNDTVPVAALEAIVAAARPHTIDICWQEGDVALVDNLRVMHGRNPYSGERKRQVLVCLAKEPKH